MRLRTAEGAERARPNSRGVLSGHLRAAVYVTAALMVVLPVVDFFVAVWPLRPTLMTWRYGAVGTASGSLITPVLGIVALLLASNRFGDRRVSVLLAAVAIPGALALIGAALLFILDALQLRSSTGSELRAVFSFSAAAAFAKLVFAGLVCGAVGIGAAVAARRAR